MINKIINYITTRVGMEPNSILIEEVMQLISENLRPDQLIGFIEKLNDIHFSTSNDNLIKIIEEILKRIKR
ncbi:MAG: hypothetical protein P1U56_16665 [Saprospiraceae bacterium]|nr:hypothetical protein [Saprospiraceae bacterium]